MTVGEVHEIQTAIPLPLFLGKDGDWWDLWLVGAVILAGIAAVFVAVTTIGSMKAHKREAEAANAELAGYKATTDRRVHEAHSAGLMAGKTAADAQTAVERAKAEIAKAQAESANANAEAARANERAAELEQQAAKLRMQLEKTRATFAARDLSDTQIAKLKEGLAGRKHRILLCTGADPEAKIYAIQWERALYMAGQEAIIPLTPCGGVTYGGGKVDTVVLWIQGKDARTITDEPLYKAIQAMGFILGFSSHLDVPGYQYDAAIEIPSWAPPSMLQFEKAAAAEAGKLPN